MRERKQKGTPRVAAFFFSGGAEILILGEPAKKRAAFIGSSMEPMSDANFAKEIHQSDGVRIAEKCISPKKRSTTPVRLWRD